MLGQIEDSLRSAIRGEIDAAVSMATVRTEEAIRIRAERSAFKKVRERLVELAAVTDASEVLWLVEGAASVPTVRNPDRIRIPDATPLARVAHPRGIIRALLGTPPA